MATVPAAGAPQGCDCHVSLWKDNKPERNSGVSVVTRCKKPVPARSESSLFTLRATSGRCLSAGTTMSCRRTVAVASLSLLDAIPVSTPLLSLRLVRKLTIFLQEATWHLHLSFLPTAHVETQQDCLENVGRESGHAGGQSQKAKRSSRAGIMNQNQGG